MSKQEVGNIIAKSHKEHTCKPKGHKKNSPPCKSVIKSFQKLCTSKYLFLKKKKLKVPYIYVEFQDKFHD